MRYNNIREEELKNKIWQDFFWDYDTTEIIGNIDFTVFPKNKQLFGFRTPLLRAEAKTWNYDIIKMFVQLILTIGKAKIFDKTQAPAYLWAFDFKKFAFIEYLKIEDIFYLNDFNRTVTPSNHESKEFKLLSDRVTKVLNQHTLIFDYEKKEKELKTFIKQNIAQAKSTTKIKINKNNIIPLYLRWTEIIKPLIDVDRLQLKSTGILDSDFFLADVFVEDHNTSDTLDDNSIKKNLFVIFEQWRYKISKQNIHQMFDAVISIKNKTTYETFWKSYKRPPARKFQEYIIDRRDLIVPQDIRERKWAYFTPRIWVELSQKYIADYFGENYQDEYYIRDCAAWTGNLLAWFTNKYNIFASTLDQADVNVMNDRIKNWANLLEAHVFQFDFLNDDFFSEKVPQALQDILKDEKKREKLIIYINPPYAEATNARTVTGTWTNKAWTSIQNRIYDRYKADLWKASNELFTQFLYRIYKEIPNSYIANFSTLKNLQASNFEKFRNHFLAKLEKLFLVPGNTFDNVKWQFPIWFFIWNTKQKEKFEVIEADIYDKNGEFIWDKKIHTNNETPNINKWIKKFDNKKSETIFGYMWNPSPDFQHCSQLYVSEKIGIEHFNFYNFTKENLIPWCVYFAVRLCIEANWLNDRDQFYYPDNSWEQDKELQSDSLIYALFHWQNRITTQQWNINYWIPFTESEVNAKEKFSSNFMSSYLKDLTLSSEAQRVYEAGKSLWIYYHKQSFTNTEKASNYNANASFYDIREYFQWRNEKSGKMNNSSTDETYNELIWNLRSEVKNLWSKISEKAFEYGFLI